MVNASNINEKATENRFKADIVLGTVLTRHILEPLSALVSQNRER